MWRDWAKAKYKFFMTSLREEQWKLEGGGGQRNNAKERLQSLVMCRVCDEWDIRDWTLLDFIIYLAASALRQTQPGEKTRIQWSHLFISWKAQMWESHEGNVKTKGALFTEYRARRAKGTPWLDFVVCNERGNVQKGSKSLLQVRFRKFSEQRRPTAQYGSPLLCLCSLWGGEYTEQGARECSIPVKMDYVPDAGNLNKINVCWASTKCQALYIPSLFNEEGRVRDEGSTGG